MKNFLTAVVVVLSFTLLPFSANAGFFGKDEWEKEDCPKNHSLAWCLADYQGRSKGIRDMSQEEFVEALKKAGVDESHIGDILGSSLGVGAGLGNLALGNLFGGGVFLLHALMPDAVEQNRRDPYIVFFDEGDQGRSETQVVTEYRNTISAAVHKAITTAIPKEAKVTETEEGIQKFEMPGHECKGRFACVVAYKNAVGSMRAEKKKVPLYLGSNFVFSGQTGSLGGVGFMGLPKEVNAASLAKTISENLPAHMYWFIPAGYLGGNPFPIVLNQGKPLFFVKPKEGDPTPVLPHVAAKLKTDEKPAVQPAPDGASGVVQTSGIAN